ncbi:hypothetical protein [Corallococcus exercitus]|uniref:hypothetical protein n=1 Tax=Corallococcus exercitus TaxID=2316736 RepID=UPI0035D49048
MQRAEHWAFELRCMRHPDMVARSVQPRGRMTVTDHEGREVGALYPIAIILDGLLCVDQGRRAARGLREPEIKAV